MKIYISDTFKYFEAGGFVFFLTFVPLLTGDFLKHLDEIDQGHSIPNEILLKDFFKAFASANILIGFFTRVITKHLLWGKYGWLEIASTSSILLNFGILANQEKVGIEGIVISILTYFFSIIYYVLSINHSNTVEINLLNPEKRKTEISKWVINIPEFKFTEVSLNKRWQKFFSKTFRITIRFLLYALVSIGITILIRLKYQYNNDILNSLSVFSCVWGMLTTICETILNTNKERP